MKKNSLILFLIIQIFLIFIFENINSILKEMEKKEIVEIKTKCDLMSDLFVEKFKFNINKMKEKGYFDRISIYSNLKSVTAISGIKKGLIYFIKSLKGDNRRIVFEKNIDSSTLKVIRKLKSIFLGFLIILGAFIVFTGFYLVFLIKKIKSDVKIKSISPLQNYLKELKDSEVELKDIVKKQQVKVVEEEELNKNIINKINSGIIFVNRFDKIDRFNSVAEVMFSQSYANARNNSLENILKGFPEILGFIKEKKDQKISSQIIEKSKTFNIDLIPIGDAGNLILVKDITEKKMREEIDGRNKNFIMLGEMTAFLAHEVKNSLGVIYGYTKTMKSKEKKLDKVNNEIKFISNMMESFLNFSKPIIGEKREKVNLVELLNKVACENKLEIKLSKKEIFINIEKALISSVFSNLIKNSKEAGADMLEVEFYDADNIEIILKDNGRGVGKKNVEKIWYPFFTTKDKGTGMGLAIVKKIVNSLGGEIFVLDSKKGTTFKIVFYK
jgi:signal transduction histidine kinase